ncbi:hypothetical protein GE21DRAFT_1097293 [Neurospora crassa]|nr:hypothetical protein GE21DRAFT_1097293 [Neurospora crassa]
MNHNVDVVEAITTTLVCLWGICLSEVVNLLGVNSIMISVVSFSTQVRGTEWFHDGVSIGPQSQTIMILTV